MAAVSAQGTVAVTERREEAEGCAGRTLAFTLGDVGRHWRPSGGEAIWQKLSQEHAHCPLASGRRGVRVDAGSPGARAGD